jgi:Kazal-type serine protease inhibitor domain
MKLKVVQFLLERFKQGEDYMLSKSIGVCVALTFLVVTGLVSVAGAAGVGDTCGTFAGIKCDGKLWCDHYAGQCKWTDPIGKCVAIPAKCPKDIHYVCGCNGRTYSNDCVRIRAHVGLAHDGRCP